MKILLISGSPRGKRATSYLLLDYLSSKLKSKGITGPIHILSKIVTSKEKMRNLMSEINSADYIVLTSPLYVDTLPAHVLKAMISIRQARNDSCPSNPKFVGIVNSGFPESDHNELALDVLRRFAIESGFEWVGGLPFGGGGMLGSTPLDEAGARGKNAKVAMDFLLEAMLSGSQIPDEAVESISKLPISNWMYIKMGQMGWRLRALKNGVYRQLNARPYTS